MKAADLFAALLVAGIVLLLTVGRAAYDAAYAFSPLLIAFAKFALLSTFGETLVSRILTGRFLRPRFGLVPKAIIWGILGMFIYTAFVIFENGVTQLIYGGAVPDSVIEQIVRAFLISLFMNLVFAPVLMTIHQLTDLFIDKHHGRFPVRELRPGDLLGMVDWNRMWSFIFARTIPLFWIPAHTITFLLPAEFRLIYAAGLSVMLGLFLALVRRRKPVPPATQGR